MTLKDAALNGRARHTQACWRRVHPVYAFHREQWGYVDRLADGEE